jgi:hypothetical protein
MSAKAPKMQRRHFEFIAECIKPALDNARLDRMSGPGAIRALARDMATALSQTNSGFNRRRFLEACGIEED